MFNQIKTDQDRNRRETFEERKDKTEQGRTKKNKNKNTSNLAYNNKREQRTKTGGETELKKLEAEQKQKTEKGEIQGSEERETEDNQIYIYTIKQTDDMKRTGESADGDKRTSSIRGRQRHGGGHESKGQTTNQTRPVPQRTKLDEDSQRTRPSAEDNTAEL